MTDPLFQRTADNQVYHYQNDHLGTPQRQIKSNGATVWRATYTAFGEATVDPDSSIENNLRFPGQYYDQETGLHHNYYRDYDPQTGRYLQEDPIGLWGGLNVHIYTSNNPIKFFDAFGLIVNVEYNKNTGMVTVTDMDSGETVYWSSKTGHFLLRRFKVNW